MKKSARIACIIAGAIIIWCLLGTARMLVLLGSALTWLQSAYYCYKSKQTTGAVCFGLMFIVTCAAGFWIVSLFT